jgi:transcriptional regulator
VRENPHYELTDLEQVRRLIRENPWATLVSSTSSGLVASHYPILLEEDREELSIVTHLGRPDEKVHELGDRELLVIVQGPHGYISPSWYGEEIGVPTWNFITAHLSGVPEVLGQDENFEVLSRLTDHFEQHVAEPRSLNATPEAAESARRTARGTVGLRLVPSRVVAKQKMSQNKPPEVVETVRGELEGDGPYASEALAREMRLVHDVGTAAD